MSLCAQKHPGVFSRLALMEPMVVVDERFHQAWSLAESMR